MLLHGCLVNRLNSRIVDRNMACVVGVGLGVLECAMGKLGFRIGAVWCAGWGGGGRVVAAGRGPERARVVVVQRIRGRSARERES